MNINIKECYRTNHCSSKEYASKWLGDDSEANASELLYNIEAMCDRYYLVWMVLEWWIDDRTEVFYTKWYNGWNEIMNSEIMKFSIPD